MTITTIFDGASWCFQQFHHGNTDQKITLNHFESTESCCFRHLKTTQQSHPRIEELVDFFYSLSLTRTLPDDLFEVRKAMDFSRSLGLEDSFLTDGK
jgi:hypothetical protein